jgi:hypothetical protein
MRDWLSSDLTYGFENQDLQEIHGLMDQQETGCLAVLNRGREVVGIVSLDVVKQAIVGNTIQPKRAISSGGWG